MDPGSLAALLSQYSYAFIVPAVIVLGPPVSLVAGILLRVGELALLPTCLALAVGELSADVLWYWLGKRYGESFVSRFGSYFGISESSTHAIKRLFGAHNGKIIFLSKITSGFGFSMAIFFTAGMAGVPFRRYMLINLAGQFIWTAALLSLGYFLGHFYLQITGVFEKGVFVAGVLILGLVAVGVLRYVRSRYLSEL
jgi:membrane protein DedA with SNARE-associated domain